MTTKFYQCELSQGTRRQIAWIAERGATMGASVALKDADGSESFWKVESVGTKGIDEAELKGMQRVHRGATPSLAK